MTDERLFEILTAAAVVVALAGVTAPLAGIHRLEEQASASPYVKAQQDVQRIGMEIRRFVETRRSFPTGEEGACIYHLLLGEGEPPDCSPLDSGPAAPLSRFLEGTFGPDPWGRAYVVNVHGFFSPAERVQVVSGGPDGRIETPPGSLSARGDDVVAVVD